MTITQSTSPARPVLDLLLTVADRGALTENSWQGVVETRSLTAGEGRDFGSHHSHDVANQSGALAVSLHGYSPRLSMMTRYSVHSEGIQIIGVDKAGAW